MDLPPRLAAVAAFVTPGLPMADIGADHARLPAWLVRTGRVPRAVAIDDKAAPLAAAARRLANRGLAVELRQGWGCRPLGDDEVGTITIAGLGGPLMVRILAELPRGVTRLVLQPNTEPAAVRAWLHGAGWRIDAEHALEDGGRWFATIAAVPGEDPAMAPPMDPADLAWGRVERHRDLAALGRRLAAEERRLAGLPGETERRAWLALALARYRGQAE